MDECDSLKQFVIPKRRTSASEILTAVDQNSTEYKNDILEIIQQHFKHKDSLSCFTFDSPHSVQNPVLLAEFNEKKKLMKEICTDKELKCTYAFLHASSRFEAESICKEGLRVGNSEFKSLGDPLLGAYICKYPDILPPLMAGKASVGFLIIFKFIKTSLFSKGKVKTMVENKTGDALEPTPGWDCHVAKSSHQSDAPEFETSQIYVYEYDNNLEVLERPRQLLPFALVSFKVNVNKLHNSKFHASSAKKNIGYKPNWAQSYFKENETIIPDVSKKNSYHTLGFHQRQPYLLWSGSMIISNRIICTVNMYSDHFIICPFYVGPDIKLNSEFKTEKLYSHFFLDKLSQLNKKEFTVWNNIYYTYVKLKCTESTAFKFLKVANYLQDNDSSLLCAVNDSVMLIVSPNCKQAERLGLDDPSYMHGIFVSNSPNIFAKKSGHHQTLKQIIDGVNKAMPSPSINKSDPRQIKKLMALEESLSAIDLLSKSKVQESYQEEVAETNINPLTNTDLGEPMDKEPFLCKAPSSNDNQLEDATAMSPCRNDKIDFGEDPNSTLSLIKDPDTDASDANQVNEIEHKLEQDIIKLKLSFKTLYMPFMKKSIKSAKALPDVDDGDNATKETKEQDGNDDKCLHIPSGHSDCNDSTYIEDKIESGTCDEKYVTGLYDEDDFEDSEKNIDMEVKDKFEEDDDDLMDDDLADQIVLKCLQPSFMSPHIKLDSLSHSSIAHIDQDMKMDIGSQIEGIDAYLTSKSNHWLNIKDESDIKMEPLQVVSYKKRHEDGLESGEILSSNERFDSGDECNREGEEIIISDDDTDGGSSVVVLEHLCSIPTQRKSLQKRIHESVSPPIVYEYGDDGQIVYRNIVVNVLNNARTLELKKDNLWSSYGKEKSVLDEDALLEIFGKNVPLQQCARKVSTVSNSENRQESFIENQLIFESMIASDSVQRRLEIGSPSPDLKVAKLIQDTHYSPYTRSKEDETTDSWEKFLVMFLNECPSGVLDPDKNLTTIFQSDPKLSTTFQHQSMPRFYRPLYVYKATFEEIQETFGILSKEDQDDDEPVYNNDEIRFYEERKKCASLMDEWISEKSSYVNMENDIGICNLRWFQCLNKGDKSKVEMRPLRKTHDDFVDSHFFIASVEDEMSRSGIPFLEDVKEESPQSIQGNEDFSFPFFLESSLNAWPGRLQSVDIPQKRHSIPRKIFKTLPHVLSLEIHTYDDPRLSPSLSADSIYQSFLIGHDDKGDDRDDILTPDICYLKTDPENVIVTVYFQPKSDFSSIQSKSNEFDTKGALADDYKMNQDLSSAKTSVDMLETSTNSRINEHSGCNSSKILQSGESDYIICENKVSIGVSNYSHGHELHSSSTCDDISESESTDAAIGQSIHLNFSSKTGLDSEDKPVEEGVQNVNYLTQKYSPSISVEKDQFQMSKPALKLNHDRFFELNGCRTHKMLKRTECPKKYLMKGFQSKRNVFDNGASKFRMHSNSCKLKNPVKFNQVCKSCKKFFINKYLKCHRSISLNCKDNRDSFLINAILSLMCYKHLQGKCPHDTKKSSNFFNYFKDVLLNRKMTFSRNYVQLEKTVGTVARHLQKCNKFHHSMFLSALALNYCSKNIKKAKDLSNQHKQENKSIDLVVQSCITNFKFEMDVVLSEVAIESSGESNKIASETSFHKKDPSSKNHFLDLSRFSKDPSSFRTTFGKKIPIEHSSLSLRNSLEIQKPDLFHKIRNDGEKVENSQNQTKMGLHRCGSPKTKLNKPHKKVKLTATGGKLVHSIPSSFMPEFRKIKSKSFVAGSPLCKVSSSDEVVTFPREICNQDISICSTSLEISNKKFEHVSKEAPRNKVQDSQYNECITTTQETSSNIQEVTSNFFMPNEPNIGYFSKEANHQYATFSVREPLLGQRLIYPNPTIGLQYPWNNMVLTFQSPSPILSMTYPMPHPITICNSLIPPNVAPPPPHPIASFYHIPPPFCQKVPSPVGRPYMQNIIPPVTNVRILKEQAIADPRCEQESLSGHSKRIYVFNKDRSLTHNIEKFLQFKGALKFDPFNIVMLRNVPNIQCFVLIHLQDLDKLDKIPNILQLKKDLRVQFVVYKNVQDVKYQKFELIFPKGGMLIVEEETFLTLDAVTFQNLCGSLKKQTVEKVKPWRLMLSGTIKRVLDDLICGSSSTIHAHHYKGLLKVLKEFENSGLIHFSASSDLILRPTKMQDYLENCLQLQSSYCFQFRHFLFLTEELITNEDSSKFTLRGIDILTISAFARGFLSMVIESPKIYHQAKFKTSTPEYYDAVLSSAARPCAISF